MEKELRIFNFTEIEKREDGQSKNKLIGYASVFNSETEITGMFREVIKPGAFKRAITENQDVRALVDHNPTLILGRTKSGTLKLTEDAKGLRVEIDVADTQVGRDILESIARGDVDQMSFGFIIRKQRWIDGTPKPLREIEDVDLFDVSAVTYPAYEDTEISLRNTNSQIEAFNEYKRSLVIPDQEYIDNYNEILDVKLKIAENS